jgi:hypothetical protein
MAPPNKTPQNIMRFVLAQPVQIKPCIDWSSALGNSRSGFPVQIHQWRLRWGTRC